MKNFLEKYASDKVFDFLLLKLHELLFSIRRVAGLKRNIALPASLVGGSDVDYTPLLVDDFVVLADRPFASAGGRHRSSQLARSALKTGRRVYYLYIRGDEESDRADAHGWAAPLVLLNATAITPTDLFGRLGTQATLLFDIPHPLYLPFLDEAQERGLHTVYEELEPWGTQSGGEWFAEDVHRQFVIRSRHVVAASGRLLERVQAVGRDDAVVLPDAADETIFGPYHSHPLPMEYATSPRYRTRFISVGTSGGEPIAWEYVVQAALDHPEAGFFFIGEAENPGGLPKNVHLLGPRQIGELPSYLEHADGALLPLVPDGNNEFGSPLPVFEYLFMGKPVISTVLPDFAQLPVIVPVRSEREFSERCSVIDKLSLDKGGRETFIAGNSWQVRLSGILPHKSSRCVTAVFLIHNNAAIIGRALRTLLLHCSHVLREVIVVDNASVDGGGDIVRTGFPDVTVLTNEKNGCSSGRNLAIARAVGDYIAFFDSDQWFTSCSFISEALAVLERYPRVGAVGWGAGWFSEERGDMRGPIVDDLPKRGMDTPEATKLGFRTDIAYLATCGLVVPRTIVQQTAGFDTAYDPTCFEDTDFSFQLKSLGYLLAYRDLTGIQHQPHQTTKARSGSIEYRQLFRNNARYFKKKWSSHPEFFVDCPGRDGC